MFARLTSFAGRYSQLFWALVLIQLIVSVGFSAAMPFVSLYLHTQRGLPMTLVGTMLLLAGLGAAGGRIVGGEVADRAGRRPLLLGGMGAYAVSLALLAAFIYVRSPIWAVGAAFLLVRVAGEAIRPGLMSIVADVVDAEHRVEAYALFWLGSNAGWAIGPAIGGFLVDMSYAAVFVFTTCTGLLGLVLSVVFIRESLQQKDVARFALKRLLDVGRDSQFLVFCGWAVLLFIVMGQFVSTLAVFSTQSIGISESQLGWLFTVNGIVIILLQWPASRLVGRIGIRWGLVLGSLGFSLGYFSVGLVPSFGFLIGSMIIITLGEITFLPISMAAVANMAPAARVGRYMGFFGLGESLGWSLGPFIGGALFDRLAGHSVLLWGIVAGIGVVAAAGFMLTTGEGKT